MMSHILKLFYPLSVNSNEYKMISFQLLTLLLKTAITSNKFCLPLSKYPEVSGLD